MSDHLTLVGLVHAQTEEGIIKTVITTSTVTIKNQPLAGVTEVACITREKKSFSETPGLLWRNDV